MARRKRLTARLPATPCTPEMKASVTAIAEDQERSVADIQRDAITLFLQRSDTKSVRIGTKKAQMLISYPENEVHDVT